jgi:hypothetical protein
MSFDEGFEFLAVNRFLENERKKLFSNYRPLISLIDVLLGKK